MPAKTMKEIAVLLKKVSFKRKLIGGVDESDVWRVIAKLQKEYRSLVEAERERAAAILEERDKYIKQLEVELLMARGEKREAENE